MKLTNSEKLILIMLSEIYEKLGIDGSAGIDPKFIKNAIYTDNTWGLEWKYTGLFPGRSSPDPVEVSEVVNYLDMWDFIEISHADLSDEDKQSLEDQVGSPFGSNVRFRGFDGNNEAEYGNIASFLILDLDRFSNFKRRAHLNSHTPMLGVYRRMYQSFEPMRRTLTSGRMTLDQLILVLKSAHR